MDSYTAQNWKTSFNCMWKEEGLAFIKFLLDSGLAVNTLNRQGTTLLCHAAECGDLQLTECLVDKGADPKLANSYGLTPFHIAAECCHKNIVEFFLNKGIAVDIRDKEDNTPLHYIALTKDISSSNSRAHYQELVHVLVNHSADIDALNRKGLTPLLLSAQNSPKHMAELLIRLGANLDCSDEKQWTVLHFACQKGWKEIVSTLVENEMDINSRTSDGKTPLSIAEENLHVEIEKLLIECGAKVETCSGPLLNLACSRGWIKVVKALVRQGWDVNAKGQFGQTPIICASLESRTRIMDFLITCGADVDGSQDLGGTMLHAACRRGDLYMVMYLVRKGCKLDLEDGSGITALVRAAENLHLDVVQYLIEQGADVSFPAETGITLLHFACEQGWLKVVESLIAKGVDVNVKTEENKTPLHGAIKKYNLKIIEDLLSKGADCNVVDSFGQTPFNMIICKSLGSGDVIYFDDIILFIRNGAYFQKDDYDIVRNNSILKEGILEDSQLCTVALTNKFNNGDLNKIYNIVGDLGMLPSISNMKITSCTPEIEKCVKLERQMKGYCNLLTAQPVLLRSFCVTSLLDYYKLD